MAGEHLPYNPEAERAVLGSLLIDPNCAAEVMKQLGPGDFCDRQNREIFETICGMVSRAQPVDGVSVLAELQKAGLAGDGVRSYILELMEITPTSASVMEYAAIVQEKARLRGAAEG